MAFGADRYASRGDTLIFLVCVALSVAAMSLPDTWRDPITTTLRRTVLAPLLDLQLATQSFKVSRVELAAVTAERDSAMLAAEFLPELRAENDRLRGLLGLTARLPPGYVAADVLHQASPTDPLTLIIGAWRRQGVRPLAPVVSPDGLIGVVAAVDENTATVDTWAYPEFRASAMAADGSVYGIVAPHGTAGPGIWLLELQGVPYRVAVPVGTPVVTSGLGGVLPRGVPIGTIIAADSASERWERTYVVQPAAHPASVTQVLVLTGAGRSAAGGDVRGAFQAEGRAP